MEHAVALRTSHLLAVMGDERSGERVSLDELLDGFRERAFGAVLLIVLLPTFIPVPFGIGAITGPLIALIAVQMLFTFEHPWLPGWIRRRQVGRARIKRFGDRFERMLTRLERICRPRLTVLVDHRAGRAFTGLQLVLLGLLLSLPIPFTNYPFGLIILMYCIALIERDGVLLAVAWALGLGAIVASALLSSEVVDLVARLFG